MIAHRAADASAALNGGIKSILRLSARRLLGQTLGAHRVSQNAPDYPEAARLRGLVAANPESWLGRRWPNPRMKARCRMSAMRTCYMTGLRRADRRRILVDNPARLYGFPG